MKADETMLRKISRGYQITLPPAFRERFDLKIGDHIEIEEAGDHLVIFPLDRRRRQAAKELHELFKEAARSDMTEEEAMELAIREIKAHRREKRQKEKTLSSGA